MTDAERLAKFMEIGRYLLDEFNLGDKVYDVRERADCSDLPPGKSSWEHPEVVKFGRMHARLRGLVNGSDPERQATEGGESCA